MKPYKKLIIAAVLCCLMTLIESCSSSTLVDVWNDPTYNEPPLKKILIIAIRKDPVQRRIWEDAFVRELSKHDVQAISSYHLFPDALPDTNQVIQSVQEKGFDGILVTRLLFAETQTRFVESYVTTEPISRYNIFRKKYDVYYLNVRHPGYVESEVIDRRAIDVWVVGDYDRMIWSATSHSPERSKVEDVQNDIADLVIPRLVKNAIIKSEK
jgi:hypothetical protein